MISSWCDSFRLIGVIDYLAEFPTAQAHEHCRPGETAAKSSQAGLDMAIGDLVREIQRYGDRNRASTAVAEALDDVVRHFRVRHFHFVRQFLKHKTIRLMAKKIIDGLHRDANALEQSLNERRDFGLD